MRAWEMLIAELCDADAQVRERKFFSLAELLAMWEEFHDAE